MITRSRLAMIVVYVIFGIAGLIFVFYPAESVDNTFSGGQLVALWGGFYLAGGFLAAGSVLIRALRKNLLATWYFEIAGLVLVLFATLIYFSALVEVSFTHDSAETVGRGLVVLALASSVGVRILETLELIGILRRFDASLRAREGSERE